MSTANNEDGWLDPRDAAASTHDGLCIVVSFCLQSRLQHTATLCKFNDDDDDDDDN